MSLYYHINCLPGGGYHGLIQRGRSERYIRTSSCETSQPSFQWVVVRLHDHVRPTWDTVELHVRESLACVNATGADMRHTWETGSGSLWVQLARCEFFTAKEVVDALRTGWRAPDAPKRIKPPADQKVWHSIVSTN